LLAELQAIARTNPIDIKVKVDKNSFINSIKMAWARAMASLGSFQMSDPLGSMNPMLNLFRGMDTAITKANGSMSKMSFLGKNLSTILSAIPAQWIFIGVAVASVVSPILALLSGLIVAAPAALAAVMWPIGAITLGLDGIKKAAENAGLFADKNGAKKGGGALGASLDAIKKKASDAFEQGLKPAFASINNLLANVDFQDSFGKVAEGLSGMFGGVTTGLEKSQGALTNIGNNIGKAFADAAPGIEAFTTGLLNLISKLSDKFPGISEAINRTGDSFVKWVDEITMKDPITGVSQLDVAMKGLGDTLSGMGGFVTDLFKDGWDNMTNGGFIESMKQFVESVRSIVTDILPGLADAFQTVASSLEGIANLIEPFAWFFEGDRPSARSLLGGLIAVAGAVALARAS
jgi:phage-related protein